MFRPAPLIALAFMAASLGCRGSEQKVPYETIEPRADLGRTPGANAFDAYCRIAERASRIRTVSLDARPTQGNRKAYLRDMAPVLRDLSSATSLACRFNYRPVPPFQAAPYREGWLKMSRALVWQVEDLVAKRQYGPAASWLVVATVFGADLGGGTFSDATLGFETMDRARAALAPYIGALTVDQARSLSVGILRALERSPAVEATVSHESSQMQAAVKLIQDAHRDGKLTALSEKFYGRSKRAINAIKEYDDERRREFFQALLKEQKRVCDLVLTNAGQPGAVRGGVELLLSGDEKAIAEQFFTTGDPWLRLRDRSLARTRLLALTASLTAIVKSGSPPPADLSKYGDSAALDPYTGSRLGYIPLGRDYILYSFGADGKDDRGDTNADRLEPDMRLEDAPL